MTRWSDAFVREALTGSSRGADIRQRYSEVSTDTRALSPGALFVALEGPRFNGHDYLGAARAAGSLDRRAPPRGTARSSA